MSTKVNSYNLEGTKTGEVTLPELFDGKPNEDLLSQYVRVYLANNRQGTRDTKDRSEVRGKARKPYKQKGSGNARHGSKKAPSMKGGGIAHGPKPQNFSLKMSKSMRFSALISAYAKRRESVIVLDAANMTDIKTSKVVSFLDTAELNGTVLFVTSEVEKNFVKSARNIPGVTVTFQALVNPYDVLKGTTIVLEKAVIETMAKSFEIDEAKEVKSEEVKEVKTEKISKTKSKVA